MFKVGWAQYPVVRDIFMTTPILRPRPFLHDRYCYREFLDEKMSKGVDLEAIEAHSLILATAD